MRRSQVLRLLCAAVVMLAGSPPLPVRAADGPSLTEVLENAGKAREAKDAAAYLRHARDLQRIAPQFPRSRLAVARGLAWTGDAKGAATELERLAADGLGYELDAEFAGVRNDPAMVAAEEKLALNRRRPVGQPLRVEVVGRPGLRPEGIAWSPRERVFYLGSIPSGEVFRGTPGAFVPAYRPSEPGWEPLGMTVDGAGRYLYVCYTRTSGGPRLSRLVQLALPRLKPTAMTDLPGPNPTCNDVGVTPDDRVLVSDFSQGRLLIWSKGTFTPVGDDLPSANGIAIDDAGRYAYVALFNGIRRIDLRDLSGTDLKPVSNVIGGLDGLYWRAGNLYGVQGTASPARIIRVRFASPGSTSVQVDTLFAGHPELTEPTTAAPQDDRFVVLSRTGLFSQSVDADPLLIHLPY